MPDTNALTNLGYFQMLIAIAAKKNSTTNFSFPIGTVAPPLSTMADPEVAVAIRPIAL
jgi:hypothetical protein